MYPSMDPEYHPGTPEYQENAEIKAQEKQALIDLEIEQWENDRFYCRRN